MNDFPSTRRRQITDPRVNMVQIAASQIVYSSVPQKFCGIYIIKDLITKWDSTFKKGFLNLYIYPHLAFALWLQIIWLPVIVSEITDMHI